MMTITDAAERLPYFLRLLGPADPYLRPRRLSPARQRRLTVLALLGESQLYKRHHMLEFRDEVWAKLKKDGFDVDQTFDQLVRKIVHEYKAIVLPPGPVLGSPLDMGNSERLRILKLAATKVLYDEAMPNLESTALKAELKGPDRLPVALTISRGLCLFLQRVHNSIP